MGLADTVTKAYMKDNSVFADAFNYLIYGGEAVVDKTMSNGDYGYFGKGDAGYAQYMTAFNRNFGGSSGGGGGGNHNNGGGGGDGSGCGCLIAIAVVVVLILIIMGG